MSDEFRRILTLEIQRTELVRIKALIATIALVLTIVSIVQFAFPEAVRELWKVDSLSFRLYPIGLFSIFFEIWVLRTIIRRMREGRDISVVRRYISAFIETSVPTMVMATEIRGMGLTTALGFAGPLAYFFFIILSTLRLDFWLSTFTGLVAAVELFCLAMYHSSEGSGIEGSIYYHAGRSQMFLIGGILAGAVGVQLRRQFEASIKAATARDRVTNLFGQHVSPQVVERLMAEGTTTEGDIRRVAVMFVDFRSFTAGASTRSPQQVVDRLDSAFEVLVEILDRHGGIVNKFLGDGFMALFGAPLESREAAHQAVLAAREMLAANDVINQSTDWPLRMGIGIHVGEVVAGSIGSPRRKEYTVIGDTVNFASRIEALNKDFKSQLLISSEVRGEIGESAVNAVAHSDVPVRGYDRPVTVWQLA